MNAPPQVCDIRHNFSNYSGNYPPLLRLWHIWGHPTLAAPSIEKLPPDGWGMGRATPRRPRFLPLMLHA